MKKPELTDEEIRSHMQFDKVLSAYKMTGPVSGAINWKPILGYSISAVVIISSALYYFLPGSKKANEKNVNQTIVPVLDSSMNLRNEKATQAVEKPVPQANRNPISKPQQPTKTESPTMSVEEKKPAPSQFIEAEPVEGYAALYEYFDRELKYPAEAVRDSVTGIVTVSFVINTESKPTQIKIENSLGTAFDNECERVIMTMPAWKAATINNKPIATRLSIPLTFKIKTVKTH